MPRSGSHLDRFLRRVHRRYVVLRAAEGMGLGALVGSAIGAVLLALLWWEGRGPVGPSMAAVGFGAAVGLAWGIARRPRLLDAATEADRQFGLADLLGSALVGGHGRVNDQPDPWAASLLAMAEARCRTLTPSAVVLNRLGARAWGGIGLATGLLLTVALLAGSPGDTRAARTNDPDRAATGEAATEPSVQPEHPLLVVGGPNRAAPPEPDNDDRSHPTPVAAAPADPNATVGARSSDAQPDPRASKSPTGEAASGTSGSGQTKPPVPQPPAAPSPGSSEPTAKIARQPTKGNTVAGGAGTAAGDSTSRAPGMSGTTSAGSRSAQPAPPPPWQSARWEQDVQQAHQAIDSERVPAPYREVVRKYFERD